jgi:hypothetical protein
MIPSALRIPSPSAPPSTYYAPLRSLPKTTPAPVFCGLPINLRHTNFQQRAAPAPLKPSRPAALQAPQPQPGVSAPNGSAAGSPLDYLHGQWQVAGKQSAGTLCATYDLNDAWLKLEPCIQGAEAAPYRRTLYVGYSKTQKCFVRMGPAADGSYVLTHCKGWTKDHDLVWNGHVFNNHGVAHKAVQTLYRRCDADSLLIVEKEMHHDKLREVARFTLQRSPCPLQALDYFLGDWQVSGFSADANFEPAPFACAMQARRQPQGLAIALRGHVGTAAYAGDFIQSYDAQRRLYLNESMQSTAASGTAWSPGWDQNMFRWTTQLRLGTAAPVEARITRYRITDTLFYVREEVLQPQGYKTFGIKYARRVK